MYPLSSNISSPGSNNGTFNNCNFVYLYFKAQQLFFKKALLATYRNN